MKYIRNFSEHSAYEAEKTKIPSPSVSYCRKENECHFMPNNVIMFKVGDLNGNTNKKVTVYYSNIKGAYNPYITDEIPITEGNRWYVYSIPSGKSLIKFKGIKEITDIIISAKINNIYNHFLENIHGNLSFIDCIFDDEMTSMWQMLDYCLSPQILGINNWDVSNITNMDGVFEYDRSLQNLDLTNWNVENVTKMDSMFHECESLQNLVGLSNWNVAKVKFMGMMFDGCNSLQNLVGLSNWDVSSVIYMYQMFRCCRSLQNLDLSTWNVRNVTEMNSMFDLCDKLQVLNLSGWDLTNITNTNMKCMFERCDSLKTIIMKGCNQTTIDKIKAQLKTDGILGNVTIITE